MTTEPPRKERPLGLSPMERLGRLWRRASAATTETMEQEQSSAPNFIPPSPRVENTPTSTSEHESNIQNETEEQTPALSNLPYYSPSIPVRSSGSKSTSFYYPLINNDASLTPRSPSLNPWQLPVDNDHIIPGLNQTSAIASPVIMPPAQTI